MMSKSTTETSPNKSVSPKKQSTNPVISLLTNRLVFFLHLFAYLAVSGLNTLIWAIASPRSIFWPFYQMFGWGFAVGLHVITYLMFNDYTEYLTKVRKSSTFNILFIYHAFLYISINVFLLIIDLLYTRALFFYYPLIFWGIAVGFHATGFFLYPATLERELKGLKKTYLDYSDKKLTSMANSKIANFWILLMHVSYYIVANIWMYAVFFLTPIGDTYTPVETTIVWGLLVGVHTFSYLLYYYVENITRIVKGFLIHLAFYGVVNGWLIYEYFTTPSNRFWPLYSLVIWGAGIFIHLFVVYKWGYFKESAVKRVKSLNPELGKYELDSKANTLAFWQWSFVAHIAIWAIGIVTIGIEFVIAGIAIGFLINPIMGWLIAVSIHGAIFFIVFKDIEGFFRTTAIIHLFVYVTTGIYLVILNAMTSAFPWSAIALGGWGIAIGLHLILAYVR
ncbi:MAG: hypothetical protein GF329_16330 [Candidatus Lokiarchaeota archaeon]|nr:hypothetical protein [Candidatus Lokiarchaeota archaeon]MBD3341728.1 hypothetical protein [Candidatus Lokiarchaeota archaeon]